MSVLSPFSLSACDFGVQSKQVMSDDTQTRAGIVGRLRSVDGTGVVRMEDRYKGPATVGALAALLPIARPGVSRHLRVLREAGLVEVRQEAQFRLYSLRPEPLAEVDEWLSAPTECPLREATSRVTGMAHGTHDHADDPRNAAILIWVNGELLPRDRAVVSVFDSGFVLGDGVWEGLRVRGGHPAFLETHLDRLYEGARAILLDVGMSREELTAAVYATLRANDMTDGVHVRLMVTRGVKSTPYQDPRVTVGPATVVVIAEHKEAMPATVENGITLFTTHVRRATPDTLDPKLNAHSKLNDITACIQAYTAGADEALMLDPHGFVATCNSTHFFVVKGTEDDPEVWTSDGRFCLGGITRGNVLRMCRDGGITARETTFSLTDVYSAREAFVTGTFAGVVPVRTVDGRTIGTGRRGPVVERLQRMYVDLVDADVAGRTAP